MDLTVEVMLPPRGAPDFSTSANSKYRVLTPVAVYWLKTVDTIGMPNTGYIHVTGVPRPQAWSEWSDEQVIARCNTILCRVWENAEGQVIERRIWAGDASVLSAGVRNTLRNNRQITVTWTQFKNVLKNLVTAANLADADIN
jgi:hypothetical protein